MEIKTSAYQNVAPRKETIQRQSKRANSPTRILFAGMTKAGSSDGDVAASENARTTASISLSGSATAKGDSTSSVVLAKIAIASSQTAQGTSLSRESGSKSGAIDSTIAPVNTGATTVSRPREWGKRKRLATRKRPEAASKRARRATTQSLQPSDQSSTETDNSEDENNTVHPQDNGARAAAKSAETEGD